MGIGLRRLRLSAGIAPGVILLAFAADGLATLTARIELRAILALDLNRYASAAALELLTFRAGTTRAV